MTNGELFPRRRCSVVFSEDEKFRYLLERRWSRGKRTLLWVMLNPSTATSEIDDPTIRRCIGFALQDFDRMLVCNLFAYRSTNPGVLPHVADPVGPGNDRTILGCARRSQKVVVAWGADEFARDRSRHVLRLLGSFHRKVYCLGFTQDGAPKHPLYVRRSEPFVEYLPPIEVA